MIAALAFYVFAAVLLGSAAMVVSARNPVHSVLFLILAFFNASALFLIAGAEFLAMILVIVYVGAVAVLFLFVVMMLDINFAALREGMQRYKWTGFAVGGLLLVELLAVMWGWRSLPNAASFRFAKIDAATTNTAQIGKLLYTDYILLFQASGLVLLVAMIGAIVLTLRDRGLTRKQNISVQIARNAGATLELMDVRRGAGVKELGILRPHAPKRALEPHAPAEPGGHH